MATYQHNFELGILPERKIDRRALGASYAFMVLLAFILVNLGVLFPDRMSFKQYRVTSIIPLPALKPEPQPVQSETGGQARNFFLRAPVFERPKLIVPREVRHIVAPEPVEAPKVVMNKFSSSSIAGYLGRGASTTLAYGRLRRQFGGSHADVSLRRCRPVASAIPMV